VPASERVPDHDRLISHDCCRKPAAFIVESSQRRMARDGMTAAI
jgi:hypothetical protein